MCHHRTALNNALLMDDAIDHDTQETLFFAANLAVNIIELWQY